MVRRNNLFVASVALALVADMAAAIGPDMDACEAFAALWSSSCAGTDEEAVYRHDEDWELSGAGVVVSNCVTEEYEDEDVYVRNPLDGELTMNYSLFARNCITCREDEDNEDIVYIRVQTNNMPKICFNSDPEVENYAEIQRIDVEMLWNPDVLHQMYVDEAALTDAATTSDFMCDRYLSRSENLPETSYFDNISSFNDEDIVGFSMDNVIIVNALTDDNTDALQTYSSQMDQCLLSVSDDNRVKYHTLSGCLQDFPVGSNTKVPELCR